MIQKIEKLIIDGFIYTKNHSQIWFTLLLLIVIPASFFFNGRQFSKVSLQNQATIENQKIGLLHDSFIALITAIPNDIESLQERILEFSQANPDITKFRISRKTDEGIVPVVALRKDIVGIAEEAVNEKGYTIAYNDPEESLIIQYFVNGSRFKQAVKVFEIQGAEYFILTETSFAQIDAVFKAREIEAFYWLFGLLAIVLALVLRHVRLIDYGYLYRQTKKANEMKDLFTNMVAHELRAPLTAMRGYASMIRENEQLESNVREQGRRIEESSERLVVIISDLLDVARIQSGKMSITKEGVDVSKVAQSAIEALASSAHKKNIELVQEGMHEPHVVIGDGKRLHQAITNLVSNAIKYTNQGRIEVVVTEFKKTVELRVKDTGMGIGAADQKKLFAPFFRVESSDVSSITGTGLGMWITKQLIELMGASIGVESIKGVGTHIVVTFQKTE